MQFFTALDQVPVGFGPSAVTIGKFDGVHLGHLRMIGQLLSDAEARSLVPTVLTFDRNPLSLLSPESCPLPLVSNEQKRELLEKVGVAATVMLAFDRSLSEQAPEEFVHRALVDTLNARLVFVGPDFRFGKGGAGNPALLERMGAEYGFEVRALPIVAKDDRRVSSTWVRELLADGDVSRAAELLGRPPMVRGVVVPGAKRGRQLGFPTANLATESEGLIPADGVYAAWATVDGERMPAAVSVGNNPTFDGVPERQVEAHLLGNDFGELDIDLYGKTMELDFIDRIRGMEKFESVDELVTRIGQDVERVRELLSAEPA